MARKSTALQPGILPSRRAKSENLKRSPSSEMPLPELRHARALSQAKLAKHLEVNQAAVSKIEHRTDMYVSTLRAYIQAMGGNLQMVARFPDGEVKILNFPEEPPRPVEGA